MPTRYVLRAYWHARREPVQECANRLGRCLAELAMCDPVLAEWCEIGQVRNQFRGDGGGAYDSARLIALLERGRNRRERGGKPIDEFGFRVGMWNGMKPPTEANLNVKCGLYWQSDTTTVNLSNSVLLDFPQTLGKLSSSQRMAKVLATIAKTWEPDWAGVMSLEAMEERGFNADTPFVDWMLFLPRKLDSLPEPSVVLELPSGGSIIVVQPNISSANIQENLQIINRVEGAIKKMAGGPHLT